ncbi:MAG: FAD-dependent oxidoreductase [Lentisphaeria bacterium]|nr:FAD-dependent oxidoreductase [Lentisphaeria bacterium]
MRYDVIVVGAGSAGFGAAVGAARTGKKVLLLDGNSSPGGVTVFSGCPVFTPYQSFEDKPPRGVFKEFLDRLGDRWGYFEGAPACKTSEFDASLVMTRILKESGVDMLFYATVTEAECSQDRIRSVTVFCCGRRLSFEADHFVDATGDAMLTDMAGGRTVTAPEDESMTKTVLFRVSGVSKFDKPGIRKIFSSLDFPYPWQDNFMGTRVGNDGNDILINLTAVRGNALDPFDRTRMDIELREQVDVIHRWLKEKVPGFENCRISAVAPVIGVRGSRFIAGRTVITCEDIDNDTPVSDPVADGRRSYGDHFVDRFRSPWAKNHVGTHRIPYASLIHEKIVNLVAAGRCISIEPRAATSIRYAPCCMATGQAAGVASALGIPAYSVLRDELVRQGAL